METCWWKHRSNSWEKKIILYTHSAVHADFPPLGSQCMHLRTSLFHVDDHMENNVEDS